MGCGEKLLHGIERRQQASTGTETSLHQTEAV
jgi:hypothetical protein